MHLFSVATSLVLFRICKFPLLLDSASDLFLDFPPLNLGFAGCHARQFRGFRVCCSQFWDGGKPLDTCFGFRACYCLPSLSLGSGLNILFHFLLLLGSGSDFFWKVMNRGSLNRAVFLRPDTREHKKWEALPFSVQGSL